MRIEITPDGDERFVQGGAPRRGKRYTLMERNFSLFFGLSIQMYESTLVSDDAPVDRFFEGNKDALSERQIRGMNLFEEARCADCHSGAEFTNASVRATSTEQIERMLTGNCETGVYDQGFYNIGVRPTDEDRGIGADDPFGNPLSIAVLLTEDPANVPSKELLTIDYPNKLDPPPQEGERTAVQGAFKVPTMRNVELTAPYFHTGGYRTLRQVVEFYNRGGDFRDENEAFIDLGIGELGLTDDEIGAIVAFLRALTDERVRNQEAPFDHPGLVVPNGHPVGADGVPLIDEQGKAQDNVIVVEPVGRNGGPLPQGFLE